MRWMKVKEVKEVKDEVDEGGSHLTRHRRFENCSSIL
jgi:hypothetical protein